SDDTARHLVLQFENIVDGAAETVGPDMRATRRVYQLPSDAHKVAGFAHAAFEHVPHAQLAPDLARVGRFPLVGEARIAGDDEQPWQPRNCGGDLLDNAIDKVVLLDIAGHVLERQYRERGLVWQ